MPKYQNDSSDTTYRIENWSGEKVNVGPGDTVRTYRELTESDFSIVSQKPYYNPVVKVVKPAGSGDKTLSVHKLAVKAEIYNVSSYTATAYLNSKSNLPGTPVKSGAVRTLEGLKNKVSTIVLNLAGAVSSGEVVVTEFKE